MSVQPIKSNGYMLTTASMEMVLGASSQYDKRTLCSSAIVYQPILGRILS